MAKPGVQRRIANLTEAPKECSSSSNEVMSATSRISIRSSSDLEEGIMMHNAADFTVGALEEGNIPTFLMDQLGPSTTAPPIAAAAVFEKYANGPKGGSGGGGGDRMRTMPEPQVKMNFTITSDDIVEMKIEPDVILAGSDLAVSDEKNKKKKRSFAGMSFPKMDKQRATREPNNHCVPPKKRRHDLIAEGGLGEGEFV